MWPNAAARAKRPYGISTNARFLSEHDDGPAVSLVGEFSRAVVI